MELPNNITANVLRVLAHHGLADSVALTKAEDDRVFGWATDSRLLESVVLNRWPMDLDNSAEHYHGTAISYREPGGVQPALQICVHSVRTGDEANAEGRKYFLEMDLDYAAPSIRHPISLLKHAVEVVANAVTHGKTDQIKIAAMLDRRFGTEADG